MRRVIITEDVLNLGPATYHADDVHGFDDAVADMIVRNGWGKDAETGETGERVAGVVTLEPDAKVTGNGSQ